MNRELYNRKIPEGVANTPAYKIKSRVMVLKGGSDALHLMGNIGRDEDDLISVRAEDEEYYIGTFHEGFGFMDVHFPKENVRQLTKDEIDSLNATFFSINGKILGKNRYDYDGYWVSQS
ncbi:hypothetical protein [Paenibacillus sp. ISL-20]|uniref:hypothetical protein n=1 Tax=Paenibacillus sp. ISL-20 TaxID=2819163 RepID=UPI001BE91CBA|nr:hypothetical protein [Paenibacillus sp. ISL-20]MBT2759889.1 hypothetical protein [Paenibacillus sp. ISL-20]